MATTKKLDEMTKDDFEDAKVAEDNRKTREAQAKTEAQSHDDDDERRVKQAKQSVEEERMENYGDTAGMDTIRGSVAQKPGIPSDQPGAQQTRHKTQEVRGTSPPPKG